MGSMVVSGAMCTCSFGAAPCSLNFLPIHMTDASKLPAANIMDHIPYVNVPGFSLCTSIANPAVAAATAAASGVLTPSTCIPTLPAPWMNGTIQTTLNNLPVVTNSSLLNCAYGGVISITFPGQVTITAT